MKRFPNITRIAATCGISLLISCLASAYGTNPAETTKAKAALQGIHRVVFLGDSITQAGDFIVDVDCWLLAHGIETEILNLGLGSETATELTAEENASHVQAYGFARPWVGERLDRVLTIPKPTNAAA